MAKVFAILKPDLRVDTLEASPELYATLERDYNQFKGHSLVALHEFTESWSTWERHPAGDEIVMLLSGRAEMVLHRATGDESVTLASAGDYVVIPRGLWHTARTSEATRMLFITPGEGTEHAEDPATV